MIANIYALMTIPKILTWKGFLIQFRKFTNSRVQKQLKKTKYFSKKRVSSVYNLYPPVPRCTSSVIAKSRLSEIKKNITITYFSKVTPMRFHANYHCYMGWLYKNSCISKSRLVWYVFLSLIFLITYFSI